jgi:trypsin
VLRRLLSLNVSTAGWLLCCALCQSCASRAPDAGFSVVQSAIVGGEPSPAGGAEDAVLLLRTVVDGQEVLCTASLVAPNLVLTARHCVAHLEDGQFNCSVKGELFDNPTGAGRLGLDLPADTLELYGGAPPRTKPVAHGLTVVSTLSSTICVNDIAFVVLDQAVALPVLPLRIHGRAAVGEAVTLVGYGLTADDAGAISVSTQPRWRKAGLSIADVGPDSLDQGVTTVPPRALLLEGPSGCSGDSGGPLLAASSNAVLGVYSLLNGVSCADTRTRHLLVHVPAFQALTEQAFAAAGAQPVPEPEISDADADADSATGVDADVDAGVVTAPTGGAPAGGGCATALHRAGGEPWPSWLGLLLVVAGSRARAARKRRLRRQ